MILERFWSLFLEPCFSIWLFCRVSFFLLLLLFYSLGLAIPFIISGILLKKFFLFSESFRKHALIVTKIGGAILLITGIAILTNQLQFLGFIMLEYFPSLGNIG